MAAIKIHGVPPSSFTWTARLACHEKGIDYELVPTMPTAAEPLNPFRKIPVLVHGELVLYETTAIVRYLDRTFTGPALWPADSVGMARCDQWVSAVCDSLVNASLRYIAARFGFLPVPPEMQRLYLDRTREIVPIFDRQLAQSRWLAGEQLSAADLFLAPLVSYLPSFPETQEILEKAPHCTRWFAEMAARPSMLATEPPERPQPMGD
jgi:glutathione S-transferase